MLGSSCRLPCPICWFAPHSQQLEEFPTLDKDASRPEHWQEWLLNREGYSTLVKYVISQSIYFLAALNPPKDILKELYCKRHRFLWVRAHHISGGKCKVHGIIVTILSSSGGVGSLDLYRFARPLCVHWMWYAWHSESKLWVGIDVPVMQLISNSSQKQQRLHLDLEMAPRLFFGIQHGWMASSAYWSMKLRHVSWFCQIFTIGVERSLNIISCAYIEVYMLKTNPKDNKLCQLLRHVGLLECLCTAPMNCPAVHVVSFCSFGLLKKMAGAVFWLNQWYTCLHIVNTANGFSLQWGHGPREWLRDSSLTLQAASIWWCTVGETPRLAC